MPKSNMIYQHDEGKIIMRDADDIFGTIIDLKVLRYSANTPRKAHNEDAGWDLFSAKSMWVWLKPVVVPIGLSMKIPYPAWGQILPRSSFSIGRFVFVHPGVIDSTFYGSEDKYEIGVLMFSLWPRKIKIGDRIAQILFHNTGGREKLVYVNSMPESPRSGGYGSTGR